MRVNSRRTFLLPPLFAVALLLTVGCNRQTVYAHYEPAPASGWEKGDTLHFYVSPVAEAGTYVEEMGLRITTTYPFMALSLMVEQSVLPAGDTSRKTLDFNLIGPNGNMLGDGVSYYQYSQPLGSIHLNKGDSLHVCVTHNMKREILPGITDIGISLTRE